MVRTNPYIVPAGEDGQRLERWLKKEFPHAKFGEIQRWCRTGQIRLDGKRVKASARMAEGQALRLPPFLLNHDADTSHIPTLTAKEIERIKSQIVYEDDAFIAYNKPAGLAAQAGTGNHRSVDRMLTAYAQQVMEKDPWTPRLIHRLDKGTSGLLLIGKTRAAAEALATQFKKRETQKIYWAILHGQLPELEGEIEAPLFKDKELQKVVLNHPQGQHALTRFTVMDAPEPGFLGVEASPVTGRMHQLRAHFAAAGAPIVGDDKYGWEGDTPESVKFPAHALLLHAREITMKHPITGKELTLKAPAPDYFPQFVK